METCIKAIIEGNNIKVLEKLSCGWNWFDYVKLGIGIIVLFIAISLTIVLVRQQSVKIIERLGKFRRLAKAGLSFRIPFIDNVAGEVDLRLQQLIVPVETKTKDNVFVQIGVAVQYLVNPEKVYDAFYRLEKPTEQISSYVFDVVRARVPALSVDEVFEKKEEIALSVKKELAETMDDFGYNIIQTLVTDIDPNAKVKESMNEINAQKRLREAAQEKGEAEKIMKVKAAEAEAESKALQGKGIADQRKAIIAGLNESVKTFSENTGIKPEEVMSLVMMTQYFDTIKDAGANKVILMPHSPAGMIDIKNQIATALELGTK